jgi:3-oxo-5-alpha-steroid 4-dehydrogenase 1
MAEIYSLSLILIFSFAAIILFLLFYVSAPYGKFSRAGWGPAIHSKWAWMIMEFPSPALMIIFFIWSVNFGIVNSIFICLWLSHYLYRTFIYSFRQSGRNKPYPLILVVMALVFNCLNGLVNGYGIFYVYSYNQEWLLSWKFVLGTFIFLMGFFINKIADEKLRNLRRNHPGEYILPHGWLFKYISCPHYFGEIVEWIGWAILTWSLPGLSFALFTFANLFPRAIVSHKWYKINFPEYPKERKAVIPFII